MESLTVEQRDTIRTAVLAGRVPHHSVARTILATGAGNAGRNRYVVLADHRGLSPHGSFYYHHTNTEPPDRRMDMTQQPTRMGDSEFARDRQNRLLRLRTLRPDGGFSYTAAGNHFFRSTELNMSFMCRL